MKSLNSRQTYQGSVEFGAGLLAHGGDVTVGGVKPVSVEGTTDDKVRRSSCSSDFK